MHNPMQVCVRVLLTAALLFCQGAHAQVERFVEGVHYTRLPDNSHARELAVQINQLPGKTEVLEIFWYGCASCNAFDPLLNAWADAQPETIDLQRSPMIWNAQTKQHARLFFAVHNLDLAERLHSEIFAEIHERNNYLLEDRDIGALLQGQGIPAAAATTALTSFALDSQLRKAEALNRELRIPAVPALVVAGKYRVNSGAAVPSHQHMLDVASFLVGKERAAAAALH